MNLETAVDRYRMEQKPMLINVCLFFAHHQTGDHASNCRF
jgi:hypothetical protein